MAHLRELAGKNQIFPHILGSGSILPLYSGYCGQRGEKRDVCDFLHALSAEISQGILQSIFEYQTMICELTGMEVSNASVYDGATAAAEAIAMCQERKRKRVLVSAAADPKVIQVVETYGYGNGMKVELIPEQEGRTDLEELRKRLGDDVACVYVQNPNYYGLLEECGEIGRLTKDKGAKCA